MADVATPSTTVDPSVPTVPKRENHIWKLAVALFVDPLPLVRAIRTGIVLVKDALWLNDHTARFGEGPTLADASADSQNDGIAKEKPSIAAQIKTFGDHEMERGEKKFTGGIGQVKDGWDYTKTSLSKLDVVGAVDGLCESTLGIRDAAGNAIQHVVTGKVISTTGELAETVTGGRNNYNSLKSSPVLAGSTNDAPAADASAVISTYSGLKASQAADTPAPATKADSTAAVTPSAVAPVAANTATVKLTPRLAAALTA